MDVAAAGKIYPDVPFTVDPERVRAFRAVFGESSGVPATFATAAEFTVIPSVVADPEVGLDFSRVLHGTQEYEYRRPIEEGETLVIRSRIDSIREMGGNGFLVLVTDLVDPDGEVVCTARSTLIERVEV
ncbi:MAG: FAS1-like dehydratase domain-containing protein [Actinomycetota bacterium]